MFSHEPEESKTIEQLTALRGNPPRIPQRAADRRKAFLVEAQLLKSSVSKSNQLRLYSWKGILFPNLGRSQREGYPMVNVAMLLIVVFGLVFGGSGVTMAAAQGSLPGDLLYPVKLLSEQVRMRITDNATETAQFSLELVNRRTEEIRMMLQAGDAPDTATELRLQQQLELCLKNALNLQSGEETKILLQLQTQLRDREQEIARLHLQDDPALLRSRDRIRLTLETHSALAELGAADPVMLQKELQLREQNRSTQNENGSQPFQFQNRNNDETMSGTGSPMGTLQIGETPLGGAGQQNPWTEATPTPGSGYGPGDSDNPWTDGTPTPGSGYGPGPGPEPTCTPQANTPSGNGAPTSTGGNSPTDTGGFGGNH